MKNHERRRPYYSLLLELIPSLSSSSVPLLIIKAKPFPITQRRYTTREEREGAIKAVLADGGGGGECQVEPIPMIAKFLVFTHFLFYSIHNVSFFVFSGRQSAADSMNHIYFSDLNPAVKS
jgi:hypothetical protein